VLEICRDCENMRKKKDMFQEELVF